MAMEHLICQSFGGLEMPSYIYRKLYPTQGSAKVESQLEALGFGDLRPGSFFIFIFLNTFSRVGCVIWVYANSNPASLPRPSAYSRNLFRWVSALFEIPLRGICICGFRQRRLRDQLFTRTSRKYKQNRRKRSEKKKLPSCPNFVQQRPHNCRNANSLSVRLCLLPPASFFKSLLNASAEPKRRS